MHRRKVHNTSLVTMFLKLQILSVCPPEVLIKPKLETYCEVVNIYHSAYHATKIHWLGIREIRQILRTNQKSNRVIPFQVILPHLKVKKKDIIFSKPSYDFMTFLLFHLPCIFDNNVLHCFSFGCHTTNFQYVQFYSITGTQLLEFTKSSYNLIWKLPV